MLKRIKRCLLPPPFPSSLRLHVPTRILPSCRTVNMNRSVLPIPLPIPLFSFLWVSLSLPLSLRPTLSVPPSLSQSLPCRLSLSVYFSLIHLLSLSLTQSGSPSLSLLLSLALFLSCSLSLSLFTSCSCTHSPSLSPCLIQVPAEGVVVGEVAISLACTSQIGGRGEPRRSHRGRQLGQTTFFTPRGCDIPPGSGRDMPPVLMGQVSAYLGLTPRMDVEEDLNNSSQAEESLLSSQGAESSSQGADSSLLSSQALDSSQVADSLPSSSLLSSQEPGSSQATASSQATDVNLNLIWFLREDEEPVEDTVSDNFACVCVRERE